MITADNDLVEQIVANVLAELQPTSPPPPVRAPVAAAVVSSHSPVTQVDLDLPVITADLLAAKVRPGQTVSISRRSVLTPSARDWLAMRKVAWTRRNHAAGASSATSARWQIAISTVTPAVATLRQSLAGWKTELLGTAKELAEHAIRAICTGEAEGVLGFCSAAETASCLANRNPKLRAAVLSSAVEIPGLFNQLGPNLFVVNPQGKSFIELRNLTRVVGSLGSPSAPLGM